MNSFEYGGTGAHLHFLHANGYPPGCYTPLFELLKTKYHVFGMHLRPLWDGSMPDEIQSWHPFSDDLLRFLSDRGPDSVIGVGHSIGAVVTLRAALRAPDKFRALVLIDPVLFVPPLLALWKITNALGMGNRNSPLVKGAQKRRRAFDDLDRVFRGYRKRNIFRYMSDDSLRTYIEGITKPNDDGYELIFPPEWEVQIYHTALQDMDIWQNLHKLEIPTIFIRGKETDTFWESAARLVKRKQPKVTVEALEKSTHILPLERPQEIFDIMHSFLQEVL